MSKERKTLKICHVLASHAEYGGLEKNVIDLATQQAAAGHTVSVLTPSAMASRFPNSVNKIVTRLERSRRNPFLKKEIKATLRQIQPDLVHAHANKPGAIIGSLKSQISCPIIATVQNLKSDQSMFAPFDEVICASQMVADTLGGKESTVIYNAVDLMPEDMIQQAIQDQAPFQNEGKLIVLAVGRFVEAKGYDILLDAIAQVTDAVLWLVGDGPLRKDLETQAQALGIQERIWMPGFLDHGIGFMPQADVFMISSRNEGGPYTLAEALRAQCPVISTRVGYAPEFLDEFALCNTSAESIQKTLRNVIKDKTLYATKMEPAYARAAKGLDLKVMTHAVEQIYLKALQ